MKLVRILSFSSLLIIVAIMIDLYVIIPIVKNELIWKIEEKESAAADAQVREQVYVLFPPIVAAKLRDLGLTGDTPKIVDVIRNGIPDDVNRTQIALRINGLNNEVYLSGGGTFDLYSRWCRADINVTTIVETIKQLNNDDLAKKGAFRWLLSHNTLPSMELNERAVLLLKLVPIVLSTEHPWNQRFVIQQLEKYGDVVSILLLTEVLEGKIALAYPNEKANPMLGSQNSIAKNRCSARALAALALANLGQKQTLPKITELTITASGDDKVVYDMAIDLLKHPTDNVSPTEPNFPEYKLRGNLECEIHSIIPGNKVGTIKMRTRTVDSNGKETIKDSEEINVSDVEFKKSTP